MSSVALLIAEFQLLATEAKRKHPDIRDAAEKAILILRNNTEQLSSGALQIEELLRPVLLGWSSKNAKVIAISLACLQRLIVLKAVPHTSLPLVITTIKDCATHGVDIQLRILQTLLSLLTTFPEIKGALLGEALLLCFRLQESRIAVVSSTAAATLRQLVMFVFDKVVDEDKRSSHMPQQKITLPDNSTVSLSPSALDAYSVFEDLCLLANSDKPNFLKLESLPKTFALELIESVLTNYHDLFKGHLEILTLLRHLLSPLLIKSLSERPIFPLILRSTRVVFILLKQFTLELPTEVEVFAMILIKMVSGDESSPSGGKKPIWVRVLATEVLRGLCGDIVLMRRFWELYDGRSANSKVFNDLVSALKRLATEKPALLGVCQQMQGIGVQGDGTTNYGLDAVAGRVAGAASTAVSGALGLQSAEAGLNLHDSVMKLQCIDQLDKADAPPIPESYIYLLGLQCLVALAEGFAESTIPLYISVGPQRSSTSLTTMLRAPKAIEDTATESQHLKTIHAMIEQGWPAMLSSLLFLIGTNLSDELFADVLHGLQSLTKAAGILNLSIPRDAFLTSLSKISIPARVVSKLDSWVEPMTPRSAGVVDGIAAFAGASMGPSQPPGLSQRNIACLKVLITTCTFLGDSLGTSWFHAFETLQNAEYVITSKGARSASMRRGSAATASKSVTQRSVSGSSNSRPNTGSVQSNRSVLLTDLEPEHVMEASQGLFEASKALEDGAFHDFVVALCKLSSEMIGMQASTDTGDYQNEEAVTEPNGDSQVPAHRRRVSGIQLTRTPRSGDFGINKLGAVASLNLHRLLYPDAEIAWNPIISHFVKVLHHPLAPSSIRIQAARTLDDILVAIPRHLPSLAAVSQAEGQQRIINALSEQVGTEGGNSTVQELKRMGLETLHQTLQSCSHTIVVGWETIIEMLGSVCRPLYGVPVLSSLSATQSQMSAPPTPISPIGPTRLPSLGLSNEKSNITLVRVAFQSLTLVCDTLSSLNPEQLKLCIATLGLFGKQMDTNIALTAAESLLWGVSDAIQLKRKDAEMEPQYSELWMFLLLELLGLCTDTRPEVRGGAIQTVFRTLQLYGGTLDLEIWDRCVWAIIFPLIESITAAMRDAAGVSSPRQIGEPIPPSERAWDESKILAFQSLGAVFNDYMISKLTLLETFPKVWATLVGLVKDSFILDNKSISTAGLRALERSVKVLQGVEPEQKTVAQDACAVVWNSWHEMGCRVVQHSTYGIQSQDTLPFTQESLIAFVDIVSCLRSTSKSLVGEEWDLERISKLMAICSSVLTYSHSNDYRADIDGLSPIQEAILRVLDKVDLTLAGAPSIVLKELANYMTLAFRGAFQVNAPDTLPTSGQTNTQKKVVRVTYIALCKTVMPKLSSIYHRFKDVSDIYANGTMEAIISALGMPIKLKYDCPAPSKFGSDAPLFKTATRSFLSIVQTCIPKLGTLAVDVPAASLENVWRQVLEAFRGALLADCAVTSTFPYEKQEVEENFDFGFITSIENDILPYIGGSTASEETIRQFGIVLQQASQINQSSKSQQALPTESRSSPKSVDDLKAIYFGSTVSNALLPRERFSYWCFELLFLACSDVAKDHIDERKKMATLFLPSLLDRCQNTLLNYVLDEELSGELPMARSREQELIYVLRNMLALKLWPGTLQVALAKLAFLPDHFQNGCGTSSPTPMAIKKVTQTSPRAHLFHCYKLLVDAASIPKKSPAIWTNDQAPTISPPRMDLAMVIDPKDSRAIRLDARQLAISCLKTLADEMGS